MHRIKMLNIVVLLLTTIVITGLSPSIHVYAQTITIRWPDQSWPSAWIDVNRDGRYDYGMEVSPWQLNSASGYIEMRFDTSTRTLYVTASLTNVQPRVATNGYPEIFVGRKPWSRTYANGLGVNFPIQASTLYTRNLYVSFYICITNLHSSMNFNIAADAWLVRSSVANNPGTSPGPGDVEIMVWVFRQNLNPAGRKVGEVTIGGRTWEVWRHDSVEWGGWQYIAFIPKGWSIRCGTVSYNAAEFIRAVRQFATVNIDNLYLLGWEVGTEWGTSSSGGVAQFSWVLSNYNVRLS